MLFYTIYAKYVVRIVTGMPMPVSYYNDGIKLEMDDKKEVSDMSVEMIIVALIGVVVAVVLFTRNIQEVKKERQSAIEDKIKALGGEIVATEQIDRRDCPYSDEFKDPDRMYKFYRISYSVEDHQKSAYGVLTMKMNWYGPSLAAKTKWLWYI